MQSLSVICPPPKSHFQTRGQRCAGNPPPMGILVSSLEPYSFSSHNVNLSGSRINIKRRHSKSLPLCLSRFQSNRRCDFERRVETTKDPGNFQSSRGGGSRTGRIRLDEKIKTSNIQLWYITILIRRVEKERCIDRSRKKSRETRRRIGSKRLRFVLKRMANRRWRGTSEYLEGGNVSWMVFLWGGEGMGSEIGPDIN